MRHALSFLVAVGILVVTLAPAADAGPLKVVSVSSPAYLYVFSPNGTVVSLLSADSFAVSGAAGLARLESRYGIGQPGSPAEGLHRYMYRLFLTDVAGLTVAPCIKSMTIRVGTVVSTLDYDGDAVAGDQVFVVTSGAPGSVGVASAVQTGGNVTFTFEGAGVCAGSGAGSGDSSFDFGLVSTRTPRFVTATLTDDAFASYTPQARAPKSFFVLAGDYWYGKLQSYLEPSTASDFELSIDTARGSRFGGTLRLRDWSDREPVVIPVEGTLSPRGRLQIVGRAKDTRFQATLEGEDGDELFSGPYRLRLPDGTSSEGTLWLAGDLRLLPTPVVER